MTGRRLAGLSAALLGASLVAACGGSAPPSPSRPAADAPSATPAPQSGSPAAVPRPTGSIVPWIDESALTAPSPTPVPVPSGTPTCLPGDLAASAEWQGGGGQMLGALTLTNVGTHPCALVGPPRLVELRSSTSTIRPITYRADRGDGSNVPGAVAGPVLLEPGGKAGSYLWWSNWCGAAKPAVTSLAVTLPSGGAPVTAGATSPGPGIGGVPRCDAPSAASTFTAYAFTPVASEVTAPSPQPAAAVLSVPSAATAGTDLVYYVTLTNLGAQPAALDPCPTYSENLVAGGVAVKLPAAVFLLLNCAAIGPALALGASVTLEVRLAIPADAASGPATLHWDMDPGGPLDTSSASAQATLTIVGPSSLQLPSAGGTCVSTQFALGPATSSYSFSTAGTRAVDVVQPIRNTGAACVLRLPATVGVASATGPFQALPVEGGGEAVDIAAGQSLSLVVRGWWWTGWTSDTGQTPSPPPCANPVSDITRIEFPLASGTIEIGFTTAWHQVCTEPVSASVSVGN